MTRETERVDRALSKLRSREYPESHRPEAVDPRLLLAMRSRRRRPSSLPWRLLAAAAVLLIFGTGFAAAAGFQRARAWLVSVRFFGLDGEEVQGEVTGIKKEDDGSTTFQVELGDQAQAEIHLQRPTTGEKRIEVQLDGQPGKPGVMEVELGEDQRRSAGYSCGPCRNRNLTVRWRC